MALTRHEIKEVHKERRYDAGWLRKQPERVFVEVDVSYTRSGKEGRTTMIIRAMDWDAYKKKGYFMA